MGLVGPGKMVQRGRVRGLLHYLEMFIFINQGISKFLLTTNLRYCQEHIILDTNVEFLEFVDIIQPTLVILNFTYLGFF